MWQKRRSPTGTRAHPGYPSGHACASMASAAVLGYLFPADAQADTDQATDAGMSTFYAGIHTPFDVQQGFQLGLALGKLVVSHASQDGSQISSSFGRPINAVWSRAATHRCSAPLT
jgi:hypothetical protein